MIENKVEVCNDLIKPYFAKSSTVRLSEIEVIEPADLICLVVYSNDPKTIYSIDKFTKEIKINAGLKFEDVIFKVKLDILKPTVIKKNRYIEKSTGQRMRIKNIDEINDEIHLISNIDECIYKLSDFWKHFELDTHYEYLKSCKKENKRKNRRVLQYGAKL